MPNLSSTIKLSLDSSAVKRGVEDMKSRFKKLGTVIKGAMLVGATATFAYFNRFRQEMDRIGKLSKRLEEAPETLQRVGLAAELAGADLETVVKGAQKLVRSFVEAEAGSKTYGRAMEVLGLNAAELLDMPLEDQLIALSKAYTESAKGGAELAAIQDLLGRSGAELIPLLREGPEGLAEAMAKAKPVSAETVQQMEYINDQMTILGQKAKFVFGTGVVEGQRFVRLVLNEAGTQIAMMLEALSQLKSFFTTGKVDDSGLAFLRQEGSAEARRIMREGKPPTPAETQARLEEDLRVAEARYQEGRGGPQQEQLLMAVKELMVQLRENARNEFAYGN